MQKQAGQNDRVRVRVLGIEAKEIQNRKGGQDGGTLIVHGFDINDVETVLICPATHFSANLSIVPKQKREGAIGFKTPVSPGAEVVRP
jgi:hypothetical protein